MHRVIECAVLWNHPQLFGFDRVRPFYERQLKDGTLSSRSQEEVTGTVRHVVCRFFSFCVRYWVDGDAPSGIRTVSLFRQKSR